MKRRFPGRLIDVDQVICDKWGQLCPDQPLGEVDDLIAATALVRKYCVVTRYVQDFARTGVQYVNPLEAPFRIHN